MTSQQVAERKTVLNNTFNAVISAVSIFYPPTVLKIAVKVFYIKIFCLILMNYTNVEKWSLLQVG